MNVLLVEDSPDQALMVESYLELASEHRVVHTATLADALERLQQEDFDVVLLDLGLPDAQGLATVNGVYGAGFEVPIVVLTAAGEAGLGMMCLQAGAQDFLQKTELSPTTLVRAVDYAAARRGDSVVVELKQELSALGEIEQDTPQVRFSPRLHKVYQRFLNEEHASDEEAARQVAEILVAKKVEAKQVLVLHARILRQMCSGVPDREIRNNLNRGRRLLVRLLAELAAGN